MSVINLLRGGGSGTSIDFTTTNQLLTNIERNLGIYRQNYIRFYSDSNNFSLRTSNSSKNWDGTIEYSTDKTTWSVWDGMTTLNGNSDGNNYNLYLRGINNTQIGGNSDDYKWILGDNCNLLGNIENLLDYQTVESNQHPNMSSYAFAYLFYQANISDISKFILGSETLTPYCYYSMFDNSSIINAPVFSAVTMNNYSCAYMFNECYSLIDIINFDSVTTLAKGCCMGMYQGCTSLAKLPRFNMLDYADNCFNHMFQDCTLIALSTIQVGEYQNEYRIPIIGRGMVDSNSFYNMFIYTGGTFTGTPSINTIYYTSNEVGNVANMLDSNNNQLQDSQGNNLQCLI